MKAHLLAFQGNSGVEIAFLALRTARVEWKAVFERKMSLYWRAAGRRPTHAAVQPKPPPLRPRDPPPSCLMATRGWRLHIYLRSTVLQTWHITVVWTTDCRFAVRRAKAPRVEQPAWCSLLRLQDVPLR